MKKIIHTVHVHSDPHHVFNALTTEAGVTGWWTSHASLESGEGGLIRFVFTGDFNPHMRQTALRQDERVEWVCIEGHPNWKDNSFTFDLREQGGETSLQFVQVYAQELDDDTYGTYNFNWGYYLNSLKLYCETGEGTPFEPDR